MAPAEPNIISTNIISTNIISTNIISTKIKRKKEQNKTKWLQRTQTLLMANTYTQIFYHIVFAVKRRANLINPVWKDDLYKYISGIISKQNQKLYIINGMPDHLHILVSCKPNIAISDLVKEIKEHSSKYINEKDWVNEKFSWQEGFGAFSVSFRNVEQVVNYIKNQEEHHRIKTFKEEYLEFLNDQNITFDEKYIFEEVK